MPWWGAYKASKLKEDPKQDPKQSSPSSFDPEKLPDRHELPNGLQAAVDKADADSRFFDDLREGK